MAASQLYEKDLYAILGVKKSDNSAAIKKQYRKLARELHPDKTKVDKKCLVPKEKWDVLLIRSTRNFSAAEKAISPNAKAKFGSSFRNRNNETIL